MGRKKMKKTSVLPLLGVIMRYTIVIHKAKEKANHEHVSNAIFLTLSKLRAELKRLAAGGLHPQRAIRAPSTQTNTLTVKKKAEPN
ncbi:MAG: hypothetical protein IPH44_33595 [Myxococcales bacterium]|nr:hypothetical protein [Myxococcales bacterium]